MKLHALLLASLALPLSAWQQGRFEQQTYMIPARDGVKLFTAVLRPVHASGPLPFLITRTPYGAARAAQGFAGSKNIADDQYLFVFQDLRGRYQSEGSFV